MCQIHRLRERKVTFRMGENEKEIDFVLIKKEHRHSIQNAKAIHGEFQHALMVADIDKKKIRNVIRKTFTERRKKLAERLENRDLKKK